jgi:hypothetical protein
MVEPKDIRVPLDPDQMSDIYEHLLTATGSASVGKVAQYLADHGILSWKTRRPFTRQNVHLAMTRSERGRALLNRVALAPTEP